jgi:hypothetical protein
MKFLEKFLLLLVKWQTEIRCSRMTLVARKAAVKRSLRKTLSAIKCPCTRSKSSEKVQSKASKASTPKTYRISSMRMLLARTMKTLRDTSLIQSR